MKLGELASRMKAIQMYNMTPEELQKMLFFRWEVAGGKDEDFPFAKEDLEIFRVRNKTGWQRKVNKSTK